MSIRDKDAHIEELESLVDKLEEQLKLVLGLASDAPELNMNNYDETEVSMLNQFMKAIYFALSAPIASQSEEDQ